jgi:hypothetical protein
MHEVALAWVVVKVRQLAAPEAQQGAPAARTQVADMAEKTVASEVYG